MCTVYMNGQELDQSLDCKMLENTDICMDQNWGPLKDVLYNF